MTRAWPSIRMCLSLISIISAFLSYFKKRSLVVSVHCRSFLFGNQADPEDPGHRKIERERYATIERAERGQWRLIERISLIQRLPFFRRRPVSFRGPVSRDV